MVESIPREIQNQLTAWNIIAVLLRLLHIGLGAAGVICPLVVVTFADQNWPVLRIKEVTLAGAASIAMFTAFEIGAVANRFRSAWKCLNAAIVAFDCGLSDLRTVVDAYRNGESIIGSLKSNPFKADQGYDTVDQSPKVKPALSLDQTGTD